MPNYKAMYFHLLGRLDEVMCLLEQAVKEGEETYIIDQPVSIHLLTEQQQE